MAEYPLIVESGLMYARLGGGDWIVDTGSPSSFGDGAVELDGSAHRVPARLSALNAEYLSRESGHAVAGLIGTDLLNTVDVVLNAPAGTVSFSQAQVEMPGSIVPLTHFLGVPLAQVTVSGVSAQVFVDTGAQIAYMPADDIAGFPSLGAYDDFYPMIGHFQTQTHAVEVEMGGVTYTLRCGCAPPAVQLTLMAADAGGIVGSAVFCDRKVGYFARRRQLVLG